MQIYDITLPLNQVLAGWPGDAPTSITRTLDVERGDTVNLGSISCSLHAGTHMDAPFHVMPQGDTVDSCDLSACTGRAMVVETAGKTLITVADLLPALTTRAPCLLIKTGGWPDHTRFPDVIPTIAEDVPDYLQKCGIRLLGVDVPSVDVISSKELPVHRALFRCSIVILESLYLADTPAGQYELTALPMKIAGGDGAPVRAILKPCVE